MPAVTPFPPRFRERFQTARSLLRLAPTTGEEDWEVRFPTNLESVDRLLEGGMARGGLLEITGCQSSGRFSVILEALATATRVGESTALVDLGGHFHPHQGEVLEMDLERFLWLHPTRFKEALASTETLIAGGFALVAVDLGIPPIVGGRGAQSCWQRLLKAARAHRTALVVSSPYRCCGPAATAVLEIKRPRPLWNDTPRSPRLLEGLETQVTLDKSQGRPPGARQELHLHFATGSVHRKAPRAVPEATAKESESPTFDVQKRSA